MRHVVNTKLPTLSFFYAIDVCFLKVHYFSVVRRALVVLFYMAKTRLKMSNRDGEKRQIDIVNVSDALSTLYMILCSLICVTE